MACGRADQPADVKFLAGIIKPACPTTPYLPGKTLGGTTMNKLTKSARHCSGWGLAFCAVLISPVILLYSGPLVVGVASDIVHAGGGTIAAAVITAGMLWAVA
jgi:hypothetical protein